MKLYMFRTVPLSIINSYSLYTQQWYMSYRQLSSRLSLQLESCLQTCVCVVCMCGVCGVCVCGVCVCGVCVVCVGVGGGGGIGK
jgi:hypothetical protein